jgi:hypothetical protein
VHYRGQKRDAVRLVARLLKNLGLGVSREKLKTCYKLQKALLGLVINSTVIEIPRKIRRTLRSLLYKLGIKDYICRNKYSLGDAYKIIASVDPERRWKKGTIEAQTAGYAAYIIHAKRNIVEIVETNEWLTQVTEPPKKWFTDDFVCFLEDKQRFIDLY